MNTESFLAHASKQPLATLAPQRGALTASGLTAQKRTELIALCKARKLKVSGTKAELIKQLLAYETPKTVPTVLQQLGQKLVIRRNIHGHFEHLDTHFVLNPDTKRVEGKQTPEGEVIPLVADDLGLCREYGFEWEPLKITADARTVVVPVDEGSEGEDEDVTDI